MKKSFQLKAAKGLSILFISTAVYCYWGTKGHIYELTFLSNFSAGLFLMSTAVCLNHKRKVPEILCLDFTMLLLLVFMVCAAFRHQFDFNGMFLFLHMLNPIFLLIYYFLFCNMNLVRQSRKVLSVILMPLFYLIFAVIYGQNTGNCIYFFLDVKTNGSLYCISVVLMLTVIQIVIGYALFYLNKLIYRRWW